MAFKRPFRYTDHVGFRVTHKTKIELGKLTEKERKTITDILRSYLEELLKKKK